MEQHGSRIISVLEQAWADIRTRHADVPEVIMITGTARTHRANELKLGHFGADLWSSKDGRKPELFVAGELFKNGGGEFSGGRQVLKTLLHEAAHGVAHTRGIKDCSRQNRYHNQKFAQIAAELGLTPPTTPHNVLGFSMCTLGDETAAAWSSTIEAIDAAGLPHLDLGPGAAIGPDGDGEKGKGGEDGEGKGKTRAGSRRPVVCGCDTPRRISITPAQLEAGPLICGVCLDRAMNKGLSAKDAIEAATFAEQDEAEDED